MERGKIKKNTYSKRGYPHSFDLYLILLLLPQSLFIHPSSLSLPMSISVSLIFPLFFFFFFIIPAATTFQLFFFIPQLLLLLCPHFEIYQLNDNHIYYSFSLYYRFNLKIQPFRKFSFII